MKEQIRNVVTLVAICAIVAILLAATNLITAPIIEENERIAINNALLEVMPDGGSFNKLDIDNQELPKIVTDVYAAENGGYVLRMTTKGYASKMNLMVGVREDGTVSGAVCLSSSETLGYEKTYGTNFVGLGSSDVDSVETVSGATLTTSAYRDAIKQAISVAAKLGDNTNTEGGAGNEE